MKINLTIDSKLFKTCKKYQIETSMIFDKVCYLLIINSSYKVEVDLSLLSLLEVMIADKLVNIVDNEYKISDLGRLFLKELDLDKVDEPQVKEVIQAKVETPIETPKADSEEAFVNKYLTLWKDPNTLKFYRAPNGQGTRSLGASRRDVKKMLNRFYDAFQIEYETKILENKKKGKLGSAFTLQDLILTCTNQYVTDLKKDQFNYCKRADYFIMKYSLDKSFKSVLSDCCEEYLDNPPQTEQFNFNFFEKFSL